MKFIPKMHPIIPDAKAENGSVKCIYIYVTGQSVKYPE